MLNNIQIIGHLGRDPEMRYLPSGAAVCNFSVATTERWKDKATGEQQERTEWHRVNAFERLAEICGEYLKKGTLVYIAGSLHSRKYTDKDGNDRVSVEIKARDMKMLGGKHDDAEPARRPPPGTASAKINASLRDPDDPRAAATGPFSDMDEDIPF